MDRHREHTSRCAICLEYGSGPSERLCNVAETKLCANCIRTIFQRSLDNANEYPASFDRTVLHISSFPFLDSNVVSFYADKAREHLAHPAARVYCSCKTFVGGLVKAQPSNYRVTAECPSEECSNNYCMICGTQIESGVQHSACDSQLVARKEDIEKPFQDLQRGRDFQTCLTCGRHIELTEACNHITCVCTEDFCYVCDEAADAGSRHWGPGKCPRYGFPSADERPSQIHGQQDTDVPILRYRRPPIAPEINPAQDRRTALEAQFETAGRLAMELRRRCEERATNAHETAERVNQAQRALEAARVAESEREGVNTRRRHRVEDVRQEMALISLETRNALRQIVAQVNEQAYHDAEDRTLAAQAVTGARTTLRDQREAQPQREGGMEPQDIVLRADGTNSRGDRPLRRSVAGDRLAATGTRDYRPRGWDDAGPDDQGADPQAE